jgi:hypothetical protein
LNNATFATMVLFLDIDSAAEPQLQGRIAGMSFASRNDKRTGASFTRAQNSAAAGSDRRANARRRA